MWCNFFRSFFMSLRNISSQMKMRSHKNALNFKRIFLRKWSLRNSLGSKLKGYFTSLRTFKSFFVQEKSGILSRKLCQCNWPEIYGMKKSWHFCKKSLRKCVKKTRQVRWPKDIKERRKDSNIVCYLFTMTQDLLNVEFVALFLSSSLHSSQ